MIKILDSNAVQFIIDNNISLQDIFCIPDDLYSEEIELMLSIKNKRLPTNIKKVSEIFSGFNESIYYKHFQFYLNNYKDFYFYNNKSIGEVYILAIAKMILEVGGATLFGSDTIEVYSNDTRLNKYVKDNFDNTRISCKKNDSIQRISSEEGLV